MSQLNAQTGSMYFSHLCDFLKHTACKVMFLFSSF